MIWLAAEIFLNLIGIDDLADYSEFIFEKDPLIDGRRHGTIVLVTPYLSQSTFISQLQKTEIN
ncbi:MAG: hypothetical protein WA865_18805 [Spirulinaceae cyanobacterium]